MIDQTELRQIAEERLRDADTLLAAGRYDGAIYLGGYVVELSLKSRICRVLNWKGFPQTRNEFQKYLSFKTHDLDVLLSLSGAEDELSQGISLNGRLWLHGTPKQGIIRLEALTRTMQNC